MCERDHQQLARAIDDYQVIGKASEREASRTAPAGGAGHRRQRNEILFEQVERGIDRV